MKRIIAQMNKELTQFSRDRLTVVLALVLPMILMWLIGSSVSLTVSDLPVVVQDLDQTATSRRYVETIGASLTFRIVPLPITAAPESALDKEEARAAIIIPPKFEADLQQGRATEVQWLIDGTDANTANIMRNNAAMISQAFNQNTFSAAPAIKANTRFWFNPGH